MAPITQTISSNISKLGHIVSNPYSRVSVIVAPTATPNIVRPVSWMGFITCNLTPSNAAITDAVIGPSNQGNGKWAT